MAVASYGFGEGLKSKSVKVDVTNTSVSLDGEINKFLESISDSRVIDIQYKTTPLTDGSFVESALIVYREHSS